MRHTGSQCPAEATLHVIGGRGKVPILWALFPGPKRFSELQRHLTAMTQKMLIQRLREMESDGLLVRTVFPVVPPHVEYALTPLGRSLAPVVKAMCRWGAPRCKSVKG